MDIRCGNCNKLFRVADEKIAGSGIRFKCSRCSQIITITKDDLEMDLLAREGSAEPAQPPAPQPAATTASQTQQQAPAPSAPQPEAQEYRPQDYQAQEYQPPQDEQQEPPSASLGDFDFSEPHAAAASSGQPEEAFGGKDFSFDAGPEQDAAPEIEISPEAAAEAEASLASSFGSDEGQNEERAGMTQPGFGQEPAPEPSPAVAPPLRTKPAAETAFGGEADLGEAFAAPDGSELGADDRDAAPMPSPSSAPQGKVSAAQKDERPREEVHPLASGNATGVVAGMGCAVPLVLLMIVGFSVMAKFMPFAADLPMVHLIAIVGTGIISLSVMIGIIIALVQARAGKKLFFLVNILIGTIFGAGLAGSQSLVASLISGSAINLQLILMSSANVAAFSFLVSILVVIARRVMVNEREETFSTGMSGLQKTGFVVSIIVLLAAVYETGTFAGKVQRSLQQNTERLQGTGKMSAINATGLQVANAHGYFEPGTGDLVITGSVRNMADRSKAGWYLVTEVRDDKETVLSTVKMLSGIQLFTAEEYEILAKRGANVEGLKQALSMSGKGTIPSGGSVDFELRVINPPKGSTRFLPSLRTFDPSQLADIVKPGAGR